MPSSSTSKKPPSSSKHSRTSTHTDRTTISHHGYWNNGDEEEDEGVVLFNGKHGGKGKGKGRADALDHVHLLRHMKRTESDDSVIGQSHLLSLPTEILPSILSLLPPRQLLPLRLISSLFDNILSDDTIWRESYVTRFASISGSTHPSLSDDETENNLGDERRRPIGEPPLGEEQMRNDRDQRLKIVRSCIGTGAGGHGWKRESLGRESVIERFSLSKSPTTVHSPHIDIVHSLGMFYTPVQVAPFKMIPKLKTGSTKSSSLPTTSTTATSIIDSTDMTSPTPIRVGPKIIGAKSRQPHRLDPAALNGGAGRSPNVISMGMNAGVAIRSDPLTGKCMQGYLGAGQITSLESIDRVPTAIHMASLNPSCCLWGLRSGHIVHSTLLNPLPTPGRLVGPSVVSDRADAHDGSIRCLWMAPPSPRSGYAGAGGVFVSGGDDGRVKLWRFDSAERKGGNPMPGKITSLWSSDPVPRSLATPRSHVVGKWRADGLSDEIVVVRCDYEEGVVVGATSRGRVWLWTGLDGDDGVVARRIHDGVEGYGEIKHLELVVNRRKGDEGMKRTAEVLVQPKGSTEVLRVDCPMDEGVDAQVSVVTFATGQAGVITSLYADLTIPPSISLPTSLVPMDFAVRLHTPSLTSPDDTPTPTTPRSTTRDAEALSRAAGLGDGRFIVAGTEEGWVYIWLWGGKAPECKGEKRAVHPISRWEAGNGAITCVTAARGLVASGSFDGLVKIWDPLSMPPTHLRTVRNRHSTPPASYPELGTQASMFYSVNNIVLESDMVVASIGHQVLGWRAGSSKGKDGKAWKGQNVGRHSAGKVSPAKGYDQKEMRKDVDESVRQIAAEQSLTRTINAQNHSVRAHYEELGFDSTDEAMQYALMVSKEESGNVSMEDLEMQAALDAVLAAEQGRDVVGDTQQPGPSGTSTWNRTREDIEAEELREVLEQIRLVEEAEAAEREAYRLSLKDM